VDSSISHDPFMPDEGADPEFREQRWARAGATPEEIAELSVSFSAMPPASKLTEARAIDGTSDIVLGQALDNMRASGDFGGLLATPAPEEETPPVEATGRPPVDEPPVDEPPAPEVEPTPEQLEEAAAHGQWEPSEQPLDVGDQSYPAWDLAGGYIGTLVGDEETGLHLLAPNREELAAKVQAILDEQAATPLTT
jgi:hypothetical protein